jgi:hypothetical protein
MDISVEFFHEAGWLHSCVEFKSESKLLITQQPALIYPA